MIVYLVVMQHLGFPRLGFVFSSTDVGHFLHGGGFLAFLLVTLKAFPFGSLEILLL
jgi:hypothetical protein